ncbi:MAG: hypothetical protein LBR53_06115 [Deltaproteobacteria bacterium]|jgi:transposase|nr:hypothetical protein [Deltaproteobacteria bacterium]
MARIPELPKHAYNYAQDIVHNPKSVSSSDYRKAVTIVVANEFGATVNRLSEIFNISRATYFRFRDDIIAQAENGGRPLKQPWGGRRNYLLTEDEEENFLLSFTRKAREGKLVSADLIHSEFENKVGRTVPRSTVTRLLERNNWRKVAPDTQRHKSDKKTQEDLKKTFHCLWQPPLKTIRKT